MAEAPKPAALWMQSVDFVAGTEAGRLDILKEIQLRINCGESVAVLGPSGSGKSTLMMLAAGLESPTRGRVLVAGRDLSQGSEDDRARFRLGRIGIVFQAFHLLPALTALENVAVPLELAGIPDARERARAALAAVDMAHRLDHLPSRLSGGECQRVALARAVAPGPALILADEPTGNLDHETGARVADVLFERAHACGATLVLVTHDPALAARCGRTIRLLDGRIAGDGGQETAP